MSSAVRYTYVDGVNNEYTLDVDPQTGEAEFDYRPITRMESSSGSYSGGNPAHGRLAKPLVDQFAQRFEQLLAATANHTTTRTMGSGIFRLEKSGVTTASFLLPFRDAQLKQWNAFAGSLKVAEGVHQSPGEDEEEEETLGLY